MAQAKAANTAALYGRSGGLAEKMAEEKLFGLTADDAGNVSTHNLASLSTDRCAAEAGQVRPRRGGSSSGTHVRRVAAAGGA